MEEVKKVYEQYKHLDSVLSDGDWLGIKESALKRCLFDLWMAIKYDMTSPSPPAEMKCVAGPFPVYPPAEMPGVTPYTTPFTGADAPPVVLGHCDRWGVRVGKKQERSCVGCTVGCPGKNKQEHVRVLDCHIDLCDDKNNDNVCMRLEGPCPRQKI